MSEDRFVAVVGAKKKATLPAAIFDAQTNVPLIHQVVTAQLAAARQGTHATKTRGEVAGGGAKPWRQKGTGRARQGSRRAPQWTGGGTVHGPQPRNYAQRTNKKMIAQALRGALSDRAREERVHVIASIGDAEKPNTKAALKSLDKFASRQLLVVLSREEDVAWLSLRNVPSVQAIAVDQLNAYDVLLSDDVVFTVSALADFTGGELEDADEPEAEAAEPEAEEKPKRKPAAKAKAAPAAEDAEPVADKSDEAAAEPEAQEKPKRKPAAKKAAEPEAKVADEAAEPEAEEKPKRKPAAKKAAEPEEKVADEAAEPEAEEKPKRKPAAKKAADPEESK
jgi:large subunit ribosomal protein L4